MALDVSMIRIAQSGHFEARLIAFVAWPWQGVGLPERVVPGTLELNVLSLRNPS